MTNLLDKDLNMLPELGLDSFFDLFTYLSAEHESVDGTLVYENVEIIRDVNLNEKQILKKGQQFQAVWFSFKTCEFEFIDWVPENGIPGHHTYVPNSETHVVVAAAELSPYLFWSCTECEQDKSTRESPLKNKPKTF